MFENPSKSLILTTLRAKRDTLISKAKLFEFSRPKNQHRNDHFGVKFKYLEKGTNVNFSVKIQKRHFCTIFQNTVFFNL